MLHAVADLLPLYARYGWRACAEKGMCVSLPTPTPPFSFVFVLPLPLCADFVAAFIPVTRDPHGAGRLLRVLCFPAGGALGTGESSTVEEVVIAPMHRTSKKGVRTPPPKTRERAFFIGLKCS